MSAIGSSPTTASSLPNSSGSYFSWYYTILSRSISEPLASGLMNGARDLAGRVVILSTALLGVYLVAVLFSRYFRGSPPPPANNSAPPADSIQRSPASVIARWAEERAEDARKAKQVFSQIVDRQNQDDRFRAPHTHHQIVHPHPAMPQAEILQLCDPQNLTEKQCIFDGDLSAEKNQIRLLMQDAKVQMLVNYIFERKEKERKAAAEHNNSPAWRICNETSPEWNPKMFALGALFVILGIKPALAIEYRTDKTLISLLMNMTNDHPNLHWKSNGGYFVNEHPFSSFDPRNFLHLSSQISLMEATELCFPISFQPETDQFLSYLLGFGPTWEAVMMDKHGYLEQNAVSCCFNKNHYYEIGKVLNQFIFKKNETRSEIENLGFAYHSQVTLLPIGSSFEESNICERMFSKTGTRCIVGGVAARTDYCKKSYTLKKWVMETYFSELGD